MGRGFRAGFAPVGVAALGSLCWLTGNQPEQCHGRRRARGFSGTLFAHGCTGAGITLGEKGVFQPGSCPDASHGDWAVTSPAPQSCSSGSSETRGHQEREGTWLNAAEESNPLALRTGRQGKAPHHHWVTPVEGSRAPLGVHGTRRDTTALPTSAPDRTPGPRKVSGI